MRKPDTDQYNYLWYQIPGQAIIIYIKVDINKHDIIINFNNRNKTCLKEERPKFEFFTYYFALFR